VQAWQVTSLGEPDEALRLVDVDPVPPGPGEVRVAVRAVGINFADVLLCRGEYQVRPDLPFSPGIELCGVVAEIGPDVTRTAVGERVVASLVGALAQDVVVPQSAVHAAPAELTDAEAAVLTVSFHTAWFALHRRARLQPGETVVVHAAGGGVGLAAVQLAAAAGARVVAVVGGEAKGEAARRAGAHVVVDRRTDDLAGALLAATDRRGADVVVDPVGGDAYDASTRAIALDGRIVLVGFAGGRVQEVRPGHVLVKNYSVLGLHWALYLQRRPDLVDHAHDELLRLVAQGLRPVVADVVPWERAPEALGRLAAGETVGRLAVGLA
jgi:NADPH:quinone reductase